MARRLHLTPGMSSGDRGYALVEALVASAILVGLASGVAQVATLTGRAVAGAGRDGLALFLAVQKLEQLKGDAAPAGPSTDYLDRDGRSIGAGPRPPVGALFIRRWTVVGSPAPGGETLALVVVVAPAERARDVWAGVVRPHDPGVVWLGTARAGR